MEKFKKRLMHDRTHNCVIPEAGIACYQEGDDLWIKEYHYHTGREGRTYQVNYCPMCGAKASTGKTVVGEKPFSNPEDKFLTIQEAEILSNLMRSIACSLDNPAFLYKEGTSKTLIMLELSLIIEKVFSWHHWIEKIPYISFPDNWEVQITPPFGGAIVRFRVKEKGYKHWISIYLDCYDVIGFYNGPYWEIYPHMGDTYRVSMENTDELIEKIKEALSKESINEYEKDHNE